MEPGDPGFVDFVPRNLHLRDACPAVDFIPANLAYVAGDFDGNLRMGQHDAGAYEYQAPVHLSETGAGIRYSVYPNPFAEGFTIANATGAENLYLYDVLGKIIWMGDAKGSNQLSHLPSGNYILIIEGTKGSSGTMLVKQ